MQLVKVTLTGADDRTHINDLLELYKQYPFVEFGILFSKSKEGFPRYPTLSKIEEIASTGLRLSAHFCGWYSREIMESQNFQLITNLHGSFERIQLNYNFSQSRNWEMKWVLEYAVNHPHKSIIFQANGSNWEGVTMAANKRLSDNIHFLYDSSGGRGKEIKSIEHPFETFTGYSGGINNENVGVIVEKILSNNSKSRVWIDLETGVRTDNCFDIKKCIEVLDICKDYIKLTVS